MFKPVHSLLFFILPLLISCSGGKIKSDKNDTVFLEKVSEKDFGYKVFIETNRGSDTYKQLLNFAFDSAETASFNESRHDLKQHYPAPLKKYNLDNLPTEWLPVYAYKNHYYLYSPAEHGNEGRRIITDSVIIFQWGVEPMSQPILAATKTNSSTWTIKTDAYYQSPPAQETIIIHVIDTKTMLSVWEEFSKLRGHSFQLFVPREYANKFNMIVKRSDGKAKVPEFNFYKVDFKALLKNK